MELEDLKKEWSQYNDTLTKSITINEQLLQKMNLNNSKKEMNNPLIYELLGVCINFLTFVYIGVVSFQELDNYLFSIPGLIGTSLLGLYTFFAIRKVTKMTGVNYLNEPIIELQTKLASIKALVLRYRKWELYLIAPLVATVLPILFLSLHNINIYEETRWFIYELIAILVIVIPLTIWLNKVVYDKRMKNTEAFLKEIEAFEKE